MEFQQKRVLTFIEGCKHLGYKPSYVYKLTSARILPFSKPNGKCIKFDIIKLDEWLLSNEIKTKNEIKNIASSYIKKLK